MCCNWLSIQNLNQHHMFRWSICIEESLSIEYNLQIKLTVNLDRVVTVELCADESMRYSAGLLWTASGRIYYGTHAFLTDDHLGNRIQDRSRYPFTHNLFTSNDKATFYTCILQYLWVIKIHSDSLSGDFYRGGDEHDIDLIHLPSKCSHSYMHAHIPS